jgi:hypothetical protein
MQAARSKQVFETVLEDKIKPPAAALANGQDTATAPAGDAAIRAVPALSAGAMRSSFAAAANQLHALTLFGSPIDTPVGGFVGLVDYAGAVAAIQAKAAALGYGAQSQSVPITGVPGGFVGRFGSNDIYVTAFAASNRQAFEVHGDIKAKYDALGGAAGALGLPQTDESGSPDQVGRFNHFEHGSIYWTPRTGPMTVRGTVRDRWAASGWELGPLGYPVQDQHRMALRGPLPLIEWCRFENGVIAGDARGGLPAPMALQSPAETLGRQAPPALLTYAQLGALFGARLNQQFMASPDNVALRPGVVLTGVTDWQYGFWGSASRSVGFRFRGFHDNGLAPDTNFVIDIRLRFNLTWSFGSFTEPVEKTLAAELVNVTVGQDGGLALAQVYASVESGITRAFISPDGGPVDPSHPEVPSGSIYVADVPTNADAVTGYIDVLDVVVTTSGDLQVLVNPLTPPQQPLGMTSWAYLRQTKVQDMLNDLT